MTARERIGITQSAHKIHPNTRQRRHHEPVLSGISSFGTASAVVGYHPQRHNVATPRWSGHILLPNVLRDGVVGDAAE